MVLADKHTDQLNKWKIVHLWPRFSHGSRNRTGNATFSPVNDTQTTEKNEARPWRHTQTNTKWVEDLNIKCKAMKLENTIGVLSNTSLRKASSDTNTKAQTMEHKHTRDTLLKKWGHAAWKFSAVPKKSSTVVVWHFIPLLFWLLGRPTTQLPNTLHAEAYS